MATLAGRHADFFRTGFGTALTDAPELLVGQVFRARDGSASAGFVARHLDGTADFDPGSGDYNLTSAGAGDVFLSKLSVQSVGDLVWKDLNSNGIQDPGEPADVTDPNGNTSEFSNCVKVGVFGGTETFTVNMTTDAVDANLTDGICDSNTSTAGTSLPCVLRTTL